MQIPQASEARLNFSISFPPNMQAKAAISDLGRLLFRTGSPKRRSGVHFAVGQKRNSIALTTRWGMMRSAEFRTSHLKLRDGFVPTNTL